MNYVSRSTAVLSLAAAVISIASAALSPDDLKRLAAHDKDWELAVVPDFGRARIEKQLQSALAEARQEFGGRGTEVAVEFLERVSRTPSNTAYFFVLYAVGDPETALALEAALMDPPRSGNALGRDEGEILVALEAVLRNDVVRTDSRVISAIAGTAAQQGARHYGYAPFVVQLLGKCRGPVALDALRKFAASPDARMREAATSALGEFSAGAILPEPAQDDTAALLAQTLKTDPERRARIQAAASLGSSPGPQPADRLREALQAESDPEVVDSIVNALVRLHAPFAGDAQACREIGARCWDPGAARVPFECWLASVNQQQVLQVAQSGPPILRALALNYLVRDRETSQPVLVRMPPPPERLTAAEQKNSLMPLAAASSRRIALATNAPTLQFESSVREALLRAAVSALSARVTSAPSGRNSISYATAHMARQALWELSGRNMATALQYADGIVPLESRYWASSDLASKDRAAYVAYRRPRQMALAVLLAVFASALFTAPKFRAIAPCLIGAALLWLALSAVETDVRELPPAPLNFLTASFVAVASAGMVCAALSLLRISWIARGLLALTGSGLLALVACGVTRSLRIFPVGSEGWETIFEPLSSAMLATISALLLLSLSFVQQRLLRRA
jgi:hypothetical protein